MLFQNRVGSHWLLVIFTIDLIGCCLRCDYHTLRRKALWHKDAWLTVSLGLIFKRDTFCSCLALFECWFVLIDFFVCPGHASHVVTINSFLSDHGSFERGIGLKCQLVLIASSNLSLFSLHPLVQCCNKYREWERWGGGGKRGGVVEAVLKGEKLFLSINKEIRLKYSNQWITWIFLPVMLPMGYHNTSSSPSYYLWHWGTLSPLPSTTCIIDYGHSTVWLLI